MRPYAFTTDLGEELVILTRREYVALRARAGDEEAEDEMTALIADEVRADLAAGIDVILPDWFVQAARRGEGTVMARLRRYRGLSPAELAAAIGVPEAQYSEIERAAALPSAAVLDRISAALQLDPLWLRRLERDRIAA